MKTTLQYFNNYFNITAFLNVFFFNKPVIFEDAESGFTLILFKGHILLNKSCILKIRDSDSSSKWNRLYPETLNTGRGTIGSPFALCRQSPCNGKRVKNSSASIKKRMIGIWIGERISIGANKKAGYVLNLGNSAKKQQYDQLGGRSATAIWNI